MMIAREGSLRVEMNCAPIPALRDDSGQACTDARIAGAVRKQDAKLGRDAWAGFVLQAAGYENMLEERARCRQACRSRRRKRRLSLAFEDGFPIVAV